MKIYLPTPPSCNMLFRTTGNKRYKTGSYVLWISKGVDCIKQQNIALKLLKDINIEIYVPRLRINSDIDNRIKPVLDLLVKAKILVDDKYVNSVYAEWIDKTKRCCVIIKSFK